MLTAGIPWIYAVPSRKMDTNEAKGLRLCRDGIKKREEETEETRSMGKRRVLSPWIYDASSDLGSTSAQWPSRSEWFP